MWDWKWQFTVCRPSFILCFPEFHTLKIPPGIGPNWHLLDVGNAELEGLLWFFDGRCMRYCDEQVGSLSLLTALCSFSPLLLLTSTKEAINSCLGRKTLKVRITKCGLCPCWPTLMSYVHLATIKRFPEALTRAYHRTILVSQ